MRKNKLTLMFIAVMVLVMLAACGNNNANGNNGNAGQSAGTVNAAGASAEGSSNAAGSKDTKEAGKGADNGKSSSEAKSFTPVTIAAEGDSLTITHQLGEAKITKNPAKVVVFDYGVLETLDKLGVDVTAVPQDNLPAHLKDKYSDSKYKNAGTLFEPDYEKLNALDPDIIFISGRSSEAYEELNKIAPTVYMAVDTTNYMESFTQNVTALGQIFGKETEADKELAAINNTIKALNAQATASGKKGLIILTTGGKVSAFGPGSRFGIIHDVFGVTPVDEGIESSTHGQSISFEFVAEKNPDYLFVVDRDAVVSEGGAEATPASKLVENDLVKKTNAYKNGKIIYLDPNYWYLSGGGLLSVAEMAKEVQEGIK